jgi:hypothetical protein
MRIDVRARVLIAMAGVAALSGIAPAAATSPTAGDLAVRPPQFIRLSEGGPAFLDYDGDASFDPAHRDWPVSLVFTGNASIATVKRALRAAGLTRRGNTHYLGYRVGAASPRFDGDRGLKGPCDANGTDLHVRLYAPTATDRFVDPEFGSVVVGTTHLDRADGCSVPPQLFGFSELAERRVAALFARRGWNVQRDRLLLGNDEPYRRDLEDPSHVWWSNGRATVIAVP